MKIVKRLAGYLFLLVALAACNARSKSAEEAEKYWNGLHDNQARIVAKIGEKLFYPNESIFTGQVIVSGNVLNVTLTDQFDGRTILNLAGDKWYERNPVADRIDNYAQSATSLKMGKIVDRKNLVGEGYMLTKGTITAVTFEKGKMIFEIDGQVAKYSDFERPDQHLPFHGLIVIKNPAISFGDVSEKEVFGSTHSN